MQRKTIGSMTAIEAAPSTIATPDLFLVVFLINKGTPSFQLTCSCETYSISKIEGPTPALQSTVRRRTGIEALIDMLMSTEIEVQLPQTSHERLLQSEF